MTVHSKRVPAFALQVDVYKDPMVGRGFMQRTAADMRSKMRLDMMMV